MISVNKDISVGSRVRFLLLLHERVTVRKSGKVPLSCRSATLIFSKIRCIVCVETHFHDFLKKIKEKETSHNDRPRSSLLSSCKCWVELQY